MDSTTFLAAQAGELDSVHLLVENRIMILDSAMPQRINARTANPSVDKVGISTTGSPSRAHQ
jgi:hypothetical protein